MESPRPVPRPSSLVVKNGFKNLIEMLHRYATAAIADCQRNGFQVCGYLPILPYRIHLLQHENALLTRFITTCCKSSAIRFNFWNSLRDIYLDIYIAVLGFFFCEK